MKVTVLGKYGPYAKPVCGATSCYFVEGKSSKIVMDMGSGALSRLLGVVDPLKIDAVIFTHLHFDHTSDLLTFGYLVEELGKKIKIYAPKDFGAWYTVLFNHSYFEVINFDENSVFDINGSKVSFFKTRHTVTSYGIRISEEKTLAYTGDTLFYENIYDDLKGADTVIADCSKPKGFKGPHMTVENAVDIAEKTGARLIASHQNVDYSPKEDLKGTGIICAEEGEVYEI